MKKNGKISKIKKKKIVYKESPWGDDDPIIGEFVTDLLPPASVLKKAKVRILNRNDDLWPALKAAEVKTFRRRARKAGLTPRGLITAIVHSYLRDS